MSPTLQDPTNVPDGLQSFLDSIGTGVGTGAAVLAMLWWVIKVQQKRSDKHDEIALKQLETMVKMEQNMAQFGVSQAKMQEAQAKTIELIQDVQSGNAILMEKMTERLSNKAG